MGYYDEGYVRPKRKKQTNVWLVSIGSSIIGGLIVLLMLPALSATGLLPYEIVQKEEAVEPVDVLNVSGNESNQPYQQTSIQVSSDITNMVEEVSEAIVGVVNIQETADFFQRDIQKVERGTGSGVVFSKDDDKALIVTNYHVITNAAKIEVSLPNGERVEAELKGTDPFTDLAVLAVDASYVDTVAEFGDSDLVRAGEPAIAIGNPLGLEFSRTVTQGIVSAKERTIPMNAGGMDWEINVIQTDAAINPGNSGGALLNIHGQVIGINSLKIAQQGQSMGILGGSGQPVEGMGFAIPINDAIPVIHDLIEHGEVKRPYLGVTLRELSSIDSFHLQETFKLPEDVNQGVFIYEHSATGSPAVVPGSPADKAGLQQMDVIVEIDGHEVKTRGDVLRYLFKEVNIGDTIELKLYRGGLPQVVEVELKDARPSEAN